MSEIQKYVQLLESYQHVERQPTAVIIKGNPLRMVDNEPIAKKYYEDIQQYLTQHGFEVTVDEGNDHTCPIDADIYVAHSRGVSREICIDDNKKSRFAKLGVMDGAVNPREEEWLRWLEEEYFSKHITPPYSIQPPEDHFEFSSIHKKEVDRVINDYRGHNVDNNSTLPDNPVSDNGFGSNDNIFIDGDTLKCLMKPSKYLELSKKLEEPIQDIIDELTDILKSGESLGIPTLELSYTTPDKQVDDESFYIALHSGRHRMWTIREVYGDIPVEVHLLTRFELLGLLDYRPLIEYKLLNEDGTHVVSDHIVKWL